MATIALILGSVRRDRQGINVGLWLEQKLKEDVVLALNNCYGVVIFSNQTPCILIFASEPALI
jgi:hypothetical protein